MADTIRILYVDDEPDLLELGKLYLELSGEFKVDTAGSAIKALDMLLAIKYEAIVSDYQMPEMDGIALLKEVRSRSGTLPFILFTGRGREEIVVEALNNGADFYLQKGGDPEAQFAELSSKVRLAANKRKAEQALLESESRFRELTENSLDTITLFDRDLRHVYVNPNVEIQTGIPPARFIGKTHAELGFPPDLTSLWERTLREAFESGKNQRIEFLIPTGIWIDWLVVPIHAPDGSVIQVITSARDITERKKAEDEIRAASEQIMASEEELRSSFDELARSDQRIRQSEENYRSLVSNIPGTVYHCANDPDWTMHYLSPEIEALSGYPVSDFIHNAVRSYASIIHPDDRGLVDRAVQEGVGKKAIYSMEYRICRADGGIRWVYERGQGIFSPDGNLIWLNGVVLDQTERKEAEQAFINQTKSLQTLMDAIPTPVFYKNRSGVYIGCNPAFEHYLGLSRNQIIGKTVYDIAPGELADIYYRADEDLFTSRNVQQYEASVKYRDGSLHDVIFYKAPLYDEEGQVAGLVGSILDITKRKRAEEELSRSCQMLQLVLDTIPVRVFWKDKNSVFLGCNRSLALDAGYEDPAGLIGKTDYDHASAATADLYRADDREVMETGRSKLNFEEPQVRPDGSHAWLRTSKVPLHDKDGRIIGVLGTYDDITERKRAEEALSENESYLNSILHGSPVLQFVLDKDHRVVSWNRAIEEYSGVKEAEVLGTRDQWKAFYDTKRPVLADLMVDETVEKLLELYPGKFNKSPLVEGAYEVTDFFPKMKTHGVWLHFTAAPVRDVKGAIIGAVETLEDITERKIAEDALYQANKKLNLLSGITRHDIKNQLLALSGILEISKRSLGDPARTSDFIAKEEKIADTIAHQINFTRDYEDMGVKAPAWQNVHRIIKKVITRLPMQNVQVDAGDPDLELFADPLLEKVFYNLTDNALRYGGDKMTAIRVMNHEDNGMLVITVEDDGNGISAEDKKKLFTKGFGRHTGLGLYLSREILSITGITLTENGEPGRGARFEIMVPKGAYRFT